MKDYFLPGGIPMNKSYFSTEEITSYKYEELDVLVTSQKCIKVYVNQSFNFTNEMYPKTVGYHKEFTSKNGFTVGKIASLIYQVHHEVVKELWEDDENMLAFSIEGFKFDEETNSIYPFLGS